MVSTIKTVLFVVQFVTILWGNTNLLTELIKNYRALNLCFLGTLFWHSSETLSLESVVLCCKRLVYHLHKYDRFMKDNAHSCIIIKPESYTGSSPLHLYTVLCRETSSVVNTLSTV